MIAVRNLSIRQGAFQLSGIDFEIPQGKYGVLMGRTGCGKTSLLEAIAGLRKIAGGEISLNGRSVQTLEPAERQLGYVPQDGALFRTMTVRANLEFAMKLRRWPTVQIRERVEELCAWLGIGPLLSRKPAGLSGGEAQRVALGRALSFRPAVLLLDEPMSSVDEETRVRLTEQLNVLRQSGTVTVLHVTHTTSEAELLADVRLNFDGGTLTCG